MLRADCEVTVPNRQAAGAGHRTVCSASFRRSILWLAEVGIVYSSALWVRWLKLSE